MPAILILMAMELPMLMTLAQRMRQTAVKKTSTTTEQKMTKTLAPWCSALTQRFVMNRQTRTRTEFLPSTLRQNPICPKDYPEKPETTAPTQPTRDKKTPTATESVMPAMRILMAMVNRMTRITAL